MPTTPLAEAAASLSQLKNNSMAYEVLMDKLEDTKLAAIVESRKCGSSDSGVINKIVKKQYDIPINHLADSKIITIFLFL